LASSISICRILRRFGKRLLQKGGLDVSIHNAHPKKLPVKEVLNGHAQYGVANSELLLERLRGAPLVALVLYISILLPYYSHAKRLKFFPLMI